MTKSLKLTVSLATLALIGPSMIPTASVFASENTAPTVNNSSQTSLELTPINLETSIPQGEIQKLNNIVETGVFNEFQLSDENHLSLSKSIDQLKTEYQLSDEQGQYLEHILFAANTQPQISFSHGSNWVRVNLSYGDLQGALMVAAEAGPVALYAAIVALSSTIGGPAGTILSGVLGLIGAGGLADLAYMITRAGSQGKGVYFEAGFDPLPYIDQGIA